jgi:hypothetical protein
LATDDRRLAPRENDSVAADVFADSAANVCADFLADVCADFFADDAACLHDDTTRQCYRCVSGDATGEKSGHVLPHVVSLGRGGRPQLA